MLPLESCLGAGLFLAGHACRLCCLVLTWPVTFPALPCCVPLTDLIAYLKDATAPK